MDERINKLVAMDVHKLSALFQSYPIKKFKGYFSTIKKKVKKLKNSKKRGPTKKPPNLTLSEVNNQ